MFFRFFIHFFILHIFISLPFFIVFFTVFSACNSAFEWGHLEPWRYINAFIIIITTCERISKSSAKSRSPRKG